MNCPDADGVSQRGPGLVEYRLPPARALESRRRRAEKDIAARRTDVDPYELVAALRRLADQIGNAT